MNTTDNSTTPATPSHPGSPDARSARLAEIRTRRRKQISGALTRYRIAAYATGIWLLLLVAEMIYYYGFLGSDTPKPGWLTMVGIVHGWLYVVYLITTTDLGVKAKWPVPTIIITLVAGTIPFLSFVAEHRRTAEVRATHLAGDPADT